MVLRSFLSQLDLTNIAATTAFILVDKSDISGFPHTKDEELKVFNLRYMGDWSAGANWIVKIGVVIEVDADNGSIKWFHHQQIDASANTFNNVERHFKEGGFSLAGPGDNIISNNAETASTLYQTDVTLANPTGSAVAPAAGDIVLELEEVDGTATVDFDIEIEYANISDK